MVSLRLDPFDPDYPPALRELTPPIGSIWLRGRLPRGPAVALVGTRQPSDEGARYAFALAEALTHAGITVWSGGALGIDHHAHLGALHANGATALLAGGGLERPYPSDARPLWDRVLERGALLSTVPDEHPPARWTFFARNAALAALTQATVVVECALKSGARNTAAIARKLGRPVWIATQAPWSPFAPTVREELRLGALPLLHVDDLVATLSPPTGPTLPRASAVKNARPSAAQTALLLTPPASSPPAATALTPLATTSPPALPLGQARRDRGLALPPSAAALSSPASPILSDPSHPTPPPSFSSLPRPGEGPGLRPRLLAAISAGVRHLDALCEALDVAPSEVLQEATLLQLEGLLDESEQGFHIPTH